MVHTEKDYNFTDAELQYGNEGHSKQLIKYTLLQSQNDCIKHIRKLNKLKQTYEPGSPRYEMCCYSLYSSKYELKWIIEKIDEIEKELKNN